MFKNIKFGKKLNLGFGAVLSLLLITGIIAFIGLTDASSGFNSYREMARDSNLASQLQADMLMMRMNVKDFIITGSDKDLEQYHHYVKEMRELIHKAQLEIQNPKRAEKIDLVDEEVDKYNKAFEQVVEMKKQRNHYVHDTLNKIGPQMSNRLAVIMVSANKDNDLTAAYHAGIALENLLLARLHVVKFLDTNENSYVDRVHEEFKEFKREVAILDRELQNPERKNLLQEVLDHQNEYVPVFDNLVKLIFKRNELITGTLDKLGPLVAKNVEDVKLDIRSVQDSLGPELVASNQTSEIEIVVAVLLAITVGIFLANYLARSIAGPLAKSVEFAEKVAGGDFSQQIDVDQKDEVGMMAEALKKMRGSLKGAITSISGTMNRISQGDFTENVGEAGMTGDLVLIKDAINNSMEMLSDTISQVVAATDQVNSGAGQISGASQALASGTSEQAASLEEISSSMSEVGSQAKANNESANQAAQLTTQAMEVANRGNEQMKEMLGSMDNINSSSKDISKIIKVIDEIAFQTNLLALNAAVEAARAGKYGKGFAVVAEEVRNLAARSAEAAKNTTELIENSVKEVDSGVSNARKTADILNEIDDSVTKVNDLVGEIASASQEQSNSADEINKSLTQVNDVVQQNSSISEEAASASEELSGQAMELQALMGRFKLNQIAATTQQATPIQKENPAEILAEKTVNSQKMIMLDDDSFGKY